MKDIEILSGNDNNVVVIESGPDSFATAVEAVMMNCATDIAAFPLLDEEQNQNAVQILENPDDKPRLIVEYDLTRFLMGIVEPAIQGALAATVSCWRKRLNYPIIPEVHGFSASHVKNFGSGTGRHLDAIRILDDLSYGVPIGWSASISFGDDSALFSSERPAEPVLTEGFELDIKALGKKAEIAPDNTRELRSKAKIPGGYVTLIPQSPYPAEHLVEFDEGANRRGALIVHNLAKIERPRPAAYRVS